MSSLLVLLGLIALTVATVGLVKGDVRRVGLTGRKPAAALAAGALLVMLAGGALAPGQPQRTAANAQDTGAAAAAEPSLTPTLPVAASPSSGPTGSAELIAQAQAGSALALLGSLAVKGRAPRSGYSRDLFGPAWADTDRNGCDTRNDILKRDLTGETFRDGTNGCVVITGTLADPYTGRALTFTKTAASAVQIDHVVSLADAWQTGAQAWPAAKRLAFANDPLNLLAVDGPTNTAKSDSDAATWLPPARAYWCPMVSRQTAVKAKYELWVKPAERDAIARVLQSCPAEPAPVGGNPTIAPSASVAPAPKPASAAPAPSQTPASQPAAAKVYANCTQMHQDYPGGVARPGAVDRRSSGKAKYQPYYNQPLYDANAKSDRDQDGIACEA